MSGHHSTPPRGLATPRSPMFQGRFGRMFRNLPPAHYGLSDDDAVTALGSLARAMQAAGDPAKDGSDSEESGIPALYTYFGQFIDHDITFDPVTSLTKAADPDGLVDYRTPALDLDNLYGRGPGDQPYMYAGDRELALGAALSGGGVADAFDLPRFNGRALIGDPRNDENTIVSQLQGLFQRFHNRLAGDNPTLALPALQRLVRFHYQYVVLHDFLPRIVAAPVLAALKTNGHFDRGKLKFYHWKTGPFMPVEFSVAAYRFGHSMIRPGYRLNDDDAMLLPIFPTDDNPEGLAGFQPMKAGRAIDWGRFIDIDQRAYDGDDAARKKRLQLAYRIDTSIAAPLTQLPAFVAGDPPPSLALRNLIRGLRLGLPSGQAVARAMRVPVLRDDQILIAKAVDTVDPADPQTQPVGIVEAAGQAFAGNCPLWTYILAEAAHGRIDVDPPVLNGRMIKTPQLGPVGGRIVAEVFLGMLFGDGSSLLSLDPHWLPKTGADFRLKHIVDYALGNGAALG